MSYYLTVVANWGSIHFSMRQVQHAQTPTILQTPPRRLHHLQCF